MRHRMGPISLCTRLIGGPCGDGDDDDDDDDDDGSGGGCVGGGA